MEHGAQPSPSHGACAVAPRRANEVRAVPGRNNVWPRSPPLSSPPLSLWHPLSPGESDVRVNALSLTQGDVGKGWHNLRGNVFLKTRGCAAARPIVSARVCLCGVSAAPRRLERSSGVAQRLAAQRVLSVLHLPSVHMFEDWAHSPECCSEHPSSTTSRAALCTDSHSSPFGTSGPRTRECGADAIYCIGRGRPGPLSEASGFGLSQSALIGMA